MTELSAKKRRLSEENDDEEEEEAIGPLPVELVKPSKKKKGAQTKSSVTKVVRLFPRHNVVYYCYYYYNMYTKMQKKYSITKDTVYNVTAAQIHYTLYLLFKIFLFTSSTL